MTRWDGDERGHGSADAAAFAAGAGELVEAMRAADWVAEEPETHLLPHLREACAASPFELVSAEVDGDGVYVVRLRWPGAGIGAIRAAVFALVGAVSELATYVRQRGTAFEVVTGFVAGDSQFAPHGHTLRFEVDA